MIYSATAPSVELKLSGNNMGLSNCRFMLFIVLLAVRLKFHEFVYLLNFY